MIKCNLNNKHGIMDYACCCNCECLKIIKVETDMIDTTINTNYICDNCYETRILTYSHGVCELWEEEKVIRG